ncbi:MAG: hypothetical protein ACXW1C_05385 [Gallionella sp.]
MKILRIMVMMLAIGWASQTFAADAPVLLNKHQAKLLGTWTSLNGEITFNANNILQYKGQKNFYAIAQGTIQISKNKTTQLLPYRFIDGQLVITDAGQATTYTRVDAPVVP